MGKGAKAPPKPNPVAVPTEADTAQVKRTSQIEEARRRQHQRTVFGGSQGGMPNKNMLG